MEVILNTKYAKSANNIKSFFISSNKIINKRVRTFATPGIKKDAQVKKVQILAANAADGDWKSLAETLNVPLRTTYHWINDADRPDQQGGFRGNKMLEVHTAFCV